MPAAPVRLSTERWTSSVPESAAEPVATSRDTEAGCPFATTGRGLVKPFLFMRNVTADLPGELRSPSTSGSAAVRRMP